MDNLINFLIRISIFCISIYLLVAIIFAFLGIEFFYLDFLFGHNLMLDLILLIFCYNDKRFHCKYMRFLCYNLLFADLLWLIDSNFVIFSESIYQLYTLSIVWMISAIVTTSLAISHFRKVKRLKRIRNGNKNKQERLNEISKEVTNV